MSAGNRNRFLVISGTVRWRIVGWIMLTTVLMVLALILTARSIFLREVHLDANTAIVQEIQEFDTFAREAVDLGSNQRFASLTELMERYLMRQTPDRGEAFVAVTPTEVLVVDNAPNDAGERLAADRKLLASFLNSRESSGVADTADGTMRWGKRRVSAGEQQGMLLVTQFVQHNLNTVRREMLIMFAVTLGGLLLTASIAWLAAGQILAPVHRFSRLSQRIGPLDLETRLPVEDSSELSKLAVSINAMLDRLSSSHREQNHVLYAVLRQVQRQVHDLMRLRKQPELNPVQVAVLDESLEEMRRMVQDLELLLESGKPGFLNYQDVKLDDLAYRLAKELRVLYPDHAWQVEEVANASVSLDMERVLLAMRRLASNADEHNRSGETIELGSSVRRLPDGETMASLWIVNQGIPLSEEQTKAIFEPQTGLRSSDSDRPQMGMGLAVVKALAHAHGGYAWVESGTERGTVFGIDIPMVRPKAAAREEHVQQVAADAMQQET